MNSLNDFLGSLKNELVSRREKCDAIEAAGYMFARASNQDRCWRLKSAIDPNTSLPSFRWTKSRK